MRKTDGWTPEMMAEEITQLRAQLKEVREAYEMQKSAFIMMREVAREAVTALKNGRDLSGPVHRLDCALTKSAIGEQVLDTTTREAELLETIKNLELQIKHPLGGFCSYCGHHFEFGSEVSEEYRAKVVEHMSVCEKAPFQRIMQPLMLILDWMDVNLQEAECRGDEDCDHCHGLQLLEPFKKAFAASQAEKEPTR